MSINHPLGFDWHPLEGPGHPSQPKNGWLSTSKSPFVAFEFLLRTPEGAAFFPRNLPACPQSDIRRENGQNDQHQEKCVCVCVVFWKTCVFLVGAFGRARGPGCFLRMCMVKYAYIYVDSFIHIMYIYICMYILYIYIDVWIYILCVQVVCTCVLTYTYVYICVVYHHIIYLYSYYVKYLHANICFVCTYTTMCVHVCILYMYYIFKERYQGFDESQGLLC